MNLTYEKALEILKGFNIPEGHDWDRHCICVGEIAYRLAKEISKYKDIDPEKVKIMGLVHDFGRSVTHDPYRHGYEGYKLMKELGFTDYARICASHSNGTHKVEDLGPYGLKPEDFYVTNIEEMLVFIADNIENKGRIIRNYDRIRSTIVRYKEINPEFVPVLESKLKEFQEFDKVVKEIIGMSIYEFFGLDKSPVVPLEL